MRRTYANIKNEIAAVLGTCANAASLSYTNQAVERLMSRGRWVGTFQRYRVCVDQTGCITWPRQIDTIEAWAVCCSPGIIRNEWYEFLPNGPGLVDNLDDVGVTMIDRGRAVTFDEIVGVDKYLRLYADVTEAAGARMLIQGYDENGNWIRTQDVGVWVDGEYVAISTTPQVSTKKFTHITGIIKPATNGVVRLYEYNASTGAQRPLGYYEWDETEPDYRRSQVPNLSAMGSCHRSSSSSSSSSTLCEKKQITVMAKLRYIPIVNDRDWVLISNLEALKNMVKAIKAEERDLVDEAEQWERRAIRAVEKELQVYMGDGPVGVPRIESRMTFGGGAVANVI